MKKISGWALVLLLLFVLGGVAASLFFSFKQPTLKIGAASFKYQIASSDEERKKGLSTAESLPDGHALLMVFEKNGDWSVWMKDMNFAIDVVWLDEQKKVVDIKENLSPSSFPRSFSPSRPARYVIELNSGAADKNNIKIGDMVYFNEGGSE